MATSSIEWTELTWNPTTGCDKVSAGCKFCYAEIMSRRLQAMGVEKYAHGFKVRQHESVQPQTRRKQVMLIDCFRDKLLVESCCNRAESGLIEIPNSVRERELKKI